MYVREHSKALIFAPLPERCMADGMERNRATMVSVGIKVVVAHESRNSSRGAVLRAEQKRAALAQPLPPASQLQN